MVLLPQMVPPGADVMIFFSWSAHTFFYANLPQNSKITDNSLISNDLDSILPTLKKPLDLAYSFEEAICVLSEPIRLISLMPLGLELMRLACGLDLVFHHHRCLSDD